MSSRRIPLALVALLLLLAAWGTGFIYRTSIVVDGQRVFCLFDDAMISMTYVRNALEGHGLAWARQGAPVEGFTHPLWLLVMVPANLPGLDLRYRSLPVQAVSLLLLLGCVAAVWRLAHTHFVVGQQRHGLFAAALTASYQPLAYWSLLGMETALQALLAVLCVQLALDAVYGGRDRHLALWVACAASYLLRMDMALLVVAVHAYLIAMGGLRPAGRRSWIAGAAIFAVAALGYEAFRWAYFGDLLPNTYYLKLTGTPLVVRLLRGDACLLRFAENHLVLLLAAVAIALARWRDRRLWLPLGLFGIYAAYDVWVGGDAWEDVGPRADRFLTFVMPLLFVVLAAGLSATLAAWRRRAQVADGEPWRRGQLIAAAAALVGIVAADGLWPTLAGRANLRQLAGLARPALVQEHEEVLQQLHRFERLVQQPAVVATAWAGSPAFFSDYRMIDLLGYNDRQLARMPSPLRLTAANYRLFVPGHTKWNVRRALEEQRPDAFFQIWGVRREGEGPVRAVMRAHGYHEIGRFWLRDDSPWVAPPLRRHAAAQGTSG